MSMSLQTVFMYVGIGYTVWVAYGLIKAVIKGIYKGIKESL